MGRGFSDFAFREVIRHVPTTQFMSSNEIFMRVITDYGDISHNTFYRIIAHALQTGRIERTGKKRDAYNGGYRRVSRLNGMK